MAGGGVAGRGLRRRRGRGLWAVGRGGAGAGLMGGSQGGGRGVHGSQGRGDETPPPPPPQDAEGCLGGSWRLGGGVFWEWWLKGHPCTRGSQGATGGQSEVPQVPAPLGEGGYWGQSGVLRTRWFPCDPHPPKGSFSTSESLGRCWCPPPSPWGGGGSGGVCVEDLGGPPRTPPPLKRGRVL